MDEIDRILQEYGRRAKEIPEDYYALDKPANRFMYRRFTAAARELLDACPLPDAREQRVLEVGCGYHARWLLQFHAWGVPMTNLAGIDLYAPHIDHARQTMPEADLRIGDAEFLPWEDGAFDVVVQSTVFTSILSQQMRRNVAIEMQRVLKPGGVVLWYDFVYDNPRNRSVRGIGVSAVRDLFPALRLSYRRVTLAPPLARLVVPVSEGLASLLDRLPLLRTHLVATLRKPHTS